VKGPARMQFNNLRRNILAMLGEYWRQSGEKGRFSLDPIRQEFSDIPGRDMDDHIASLETNGYIELTESGDFARLTRKGLDRLKIIAVEKTTRKSLSQKNLINYETKSKNILRLS
jgi:hypothetical protein